MGVLPEAAARYVCQGLSAMSRAGQHGWFDGHHGAAVIAGTLLAYTTPLPQNIRRVVLQHVTTYIRTHQEWFDAPVTTRRTPTSIEDLRCTLVRVGQQLRRSGHGMIYGALAFNAFQAVPWMVQPDLIQGLCALLEMTTVDHPNRYYGIANYQTDARSATPAHPIPTDMKMVDIARTAFAAIDPIFPSQTIDEQRYFFGGEKIHIVTLAHAIHIYLQLREYDLARATYWQFEAHRHFARGVPPAPAAPFAEVVADSMVAPVLWSRHFQDAHALKYAASALALLPLLPKQERKTYEEQAARLFAYATREDSV